MSIAKAIKDLGKKLRAGIRKVAGGAEFVMASGGIGIFKDPCVTAGRRNP